MIIDPVLMHNTPVPYT